MFRRTMGNHPRARAVWVLLPVVLLLALVAGGCGGDDDEAAPAATAPADGGDDGNGEAAGDEEGERYSAILLNPFIGNDWRPPMQRFAEAAANQEPLSDSIESIRVVTTQDNDPNLQAPALQSAILDDPDIIIMIAASETALNTHIRQACDQGITVVTFDTFASEECAWRLGPDWVAVGRSWASWVVEESGGEGTILVDRGEPGTSASDGMNEGIDEVLADHPDVRVVEYRSRFNPGEETRAVTQLLAGHQDVVGVISQAYGAQEALDRANVDDVPATGFNYPTAMQNCIERDAPCLLVGVPPWMSAEALKLAVEVRSGERAGEPEFVPFLVPLFINNSDSEPMNENLGEVLQLSEEFTDETPEGAFLPLSPPWADIPYEEAYG